jgi:ribosomal protein L11 methyltransferase
LLAKFVQEDAAMYHELRKRGTTMPTGRFRDTVHAARIPVSDEATAHQLMSMLGETLDADTATAAVEEPDGRWAVEVHLLRPPDEVALRDLVAVVAGDGTAKSLTFSTVQTRNWVKTSLDALTPVAAGRFVVHGHHHQARLAPNRIAIEIEAGLAFGSGHHATTRGCLLALDALAKRAGMPRILDVGTGSGVLAIAAAKTWGRRVVASDIDPIAIEVARANAQQNRVAPLVGFVQAAGTTASQIKAHAPYGLVMANILLRPLVRLAVPIRPLLAPNARVILSGLLAPQANAALAAYRAQGLVLERRLTLENWTTLVMARRVSYRPSRASRD